MLGPLLLALLSLSGAVDVAANDARLNDLCFVDRQHGWAVGDRGAIWYSEDGGRHWQPQTSGITCNLQSVFFLNAELGWAAGGSAVPYTHTSSGVVLITVDGGKTWQNNRKLVLPALRRVGFFSPQYGWAIACRSAMYPSGMFTTCDGGRSWQPLPGYAAGWTGGDLFDPRSGVAVGRRCSLALVRGKELESVRNEGTELQSFCQARLFSLNSGWVVGEGGLVQSFDLSGNTPQPLCNLPKAVRHFDFAAIAVRGTKRWIAGSPGTRVFHTANGGNTWETFNTDISMPLRAIAFVDDQHGWAAGELGTILATVDGGRTWQSQRAGGSRAALLALVAEPVDVPLELIARVSGNEGYLSVVDVLCRRDIEVPSRDDVPLPDRLHEAVVRAGGCAATEAWQFPLRQAGLVVDSQQIVEAWDRVNEGQGLNALRARIVRQIRLWRPEVVVIGEARREDDPLKLLLQQAVTQAISQAADAAVFPDQIVEAGLKPWQVRLVYTAMSPGSRGASELTTAQFMPRLGRSLAEAVAEPRGLLWDRFTPSPPSLAFRGGGADRQDFMAGLGLSPGGEARRNLPPAPAEGIDLMQRIARKRRHVLAILGQSHRMASSPEQLLAQIDELTGDLDANSAGQILYQLADQYHRSGRWPAAAETFQALADRYPGHSLAHPAVRWLLQYYASSETAWRVQHDVSKERKRFERAAAIGADLERTRFDQFIEPVVRFPTAAAYRGLGKARDAERLYQSQNREENCNAWAACAQAEMHIHDPKSRSIKPVLVCTKADTKPHLDGRLDEPMWRHAKVATLQSAQHDDGDWPAEAMLTYDNEFLYLGIRCREAPRADGLGNHIAQDAETDRPAKRPRDADLARQDRVEVLLDLDRDYSTYYRLTIDCRGWTNDSLWDDPTWNPVWFVATRHEKNEWTAEAAIPLSELTGHLPKPHDVWAVGIQRVVPGIGFQSWTMPAAVAILPDGFGYLAFE